jgi:hypothetical protein
MMLNLTGLVTILITLEQQSVTQGGAIMDLSSIPPDF